MKKYAIPILFISTLTFGLSYVFLNKASLYLKPLTINAMRYGLGVISLIPFCLKKKIKNIKKLITSSFLLGLTLYVSSFFQQLVSGEEPAGKVGFISAMYLLLVPLFESLFFKKKVSLKVWFSIILSFIGLFILCDIKELSININDLYLFIAATVFALEIIVIDRFNKYNDSFHVMCGGFIIAFILNGISCLLFEKIIISNIISALPSLLFLGIIVSFFGYGLEGIGQKLTNSIISTAIFSLESVFSVIFGWLFLNQILTLKELLGCLIMFIGVILCQFFTLKK